MGVQSQLESCSIYILVSYPGHTLVKFHKVNYLRTFKTRIVAGELTTESFRLRASISGSSRGFDEADVAVLFLKKIHIIYTVLETDMIQQQSLPIAKAAAAVDVLDLYVYMIFGFWHEQRREIEH
jgi:hypothetical protein